MEARQKLDTIVQRSARHAEEAASNLPGAAAFPLDIRDREGVERTMAAIIERFGGIDILVNNASITGPRALSPFADAPAEHVHEVLDINLKGTIWCSQAREPSHAMFSTPSVGEIEVRDEIGSGTSRTDQPERPERREGHQRAHMRRLDDRCRTVWP